MFTRSKSTIAAVIAVAGVLLTAAPALAMPLGATQVTPRISESQISKTSLAALYRGHALPRATVVTPANLKPSTPVTPHMDLTARTARGESGTGDAIVALAVVLVATLGTGLLVARYLGAGTRKPQSA